MSWYTELMGRFYNPVDISIVEMEDVDDIVNVDDEMEKALWDDFSKRTACMKSWRER